MYYCKAIDPLPPNIAVQVTPLARPLGWVRFTLPYRAHACADL